MHSIHCLQTCPIDAWTSSLILDFVGGSSAEHAADLVISVDTFPTRVVSAPESASVACVANKTG
jgi:hypothetical protein